MTEEQKKTGDVLEPKAPEGTSVAPQPLTEERIAQLFDARLEKVNRGFQSTKDMGLAALQRETQALKESYGSLYQRFQELDPEAARTIQLESKTKEYAERERLEGLTKFDQDFHGSLREFITSLGLDPDDSNIDWAKDNPNYLEKHKKVLSSVTNLHKKRQGDMEKKMTQQIKDTEAKLRKDLGIDSVDTGAAIGTNTNFKKAQQAFIDDPSIENRDRLEEARRQRK